MTSRNALLGVIVGRGLREKIVVSMENGNRGKWENGNGREKKRIGGWKARGEVTSGGELYN